MVVYDIDLGATVDEGSIELVNSEGDVLWVGEIDEFGSYFWFLYVSLCYYWEQECLLMSRCTRCCLSTFDNTDFKEILLVGEG